MYTFSNYFQVLVYIVSNKFNWSVTFKLYFSGSYRNIYRQITQPRILPLFCSVMARFRSNGRNTATGFSCRIFAHERKSGEFPSTTASTTTTTTTTTPEVLTDFNCFSGQNPARNMDWILLTFKYLMFIYFYDQKSKKKDF